MERTYSFSWADPPQEALASACGAAGSPSVLLRNL